MFKITKEFVKELQNKYTSQIVSGEYSKGTWCRNRYCYVTTNVFPKDEELHYEIIEGRVELHLEGKYQNNSYRNFRNKLWTATKDNKNLEWNTWTKQRCRCTLKREHIIETEDEADKALEEIIGILDKEIEKIHNNGSPLREPDNIEPIFKEEEKDKNSILLNNACSLAQLFSLNLIIPDYQRNYCWENKQIKQLWKSIHEISAEDNQPYHLGIIILQKNIKDNVEEYSIIDGQQRLVTLTIILSILKYNGRLPLLDQSFHSTNSQRHIANCKEVIQELTDNNNLSDIGLRIMKNLRFSVLLLPETSDISLAYAFFSNENSKGVELTDFDLLKAHHLRYISNEKQAEHLARRWNTLIFTEYVELQKTLSIYLYNLRKWMRGLNYDYTQKHRTKEEFQAATTLPELPPFGERFDFYEKIQGGAHFFAYAEYFIDVLKDFEKTKPYQALINNLQGESHWKYSQVIESLLFGYYLKFREMYLPEALFCIAGNIAQHRYSNSHALDYKIREYANESKIIMMIDQASSPTFFLAECLESITLMFTTTDIDGIASRFYECLCRIYSELKPELTDETIIKYLENEYA
jgi:hypothetical protein